MKITIVPYLDKLWFSGERPSRRTSSRIYAGPISPLDHLC